MELWDVIAFIGIGFVAGAVLVGGVALVLRDAAIDPADVRVRVVGMKAGQAAKELDLHQLRAQRLQQAQITNQAIERWRAERGN